MHKYDLTVIVPGIRPLNWIKLYTSLSDFNGSCEFIFISPFDLQNDLIDCPNIRIIKDFGTPIRCQQRGLIEAQGEYITWAADDGYFCHGGLNEAFYLVDRNNYKSIVTGKYHESDNPIDMDKDFYYSLTHHGRTGAPEGSLVLNVGIVSKKLLFELGGWDAENFEVCPLAYDDFSIRAFKYGAKFVLQDMIMFKCGHMPGRSGDHGPIHDAQTEHDEPHFKEMYKENRANDRMIIDINNWKNSPEKWIRRFGA